VEVSMEKRTTIYLDDQDQEAIRTIQDEYRSRGITKMTASAAIRLALRETSRRLKQASRRRGKPDQ
jgi:hypothetical protein